MLKVTWMRASQAKQPPAGFFAALATQHRKALVVCFYWEALQQGQSVSPKKWKWKWMGLSVAGGYGTQGKDWQTGETPTFRSYKGKTSGVLAAKGKGESKKMELKWMGCLCFVGQWGKWGKAWETGEMPTIRQQARNGSVVPNSAPETED